MTRTINFNWKHLGRTLVCFALVLCLMGNAFLTPVNASAIVYSTVAIGATLVVASIVSGLGICAGADDTSLSRLVSDIITTLNLGATIDVVTWVASGFQKYAVPVSLIDAVRPLVYTGAQITRKPQEKGVALSAGETITVGYQVNISVTGHCEVFCVKNLYDGYGNFLFLSTEPFSARGKSSQLAYDFHYVYLEKIACSTWVNSGNYQFPYASYGTQKNEALVQSLCQYYQGASYTVAEGLSAGYIAEESSSIATGYADWYANSVTVPGTITGTGEEDEEDVALPIAPGKTWGDTIGKTQTDVWEGAATWTDTNTDTEAGTGAGTNTGAISVTIPGINALVNFFTGTAVVESPLTAIRFGALFDLFPFNIPKGIYDTINFWNASASPPVISIPLPNVTRGGVDVDTYDLDFAEIPGMNTLAALIRGGELILFAIGLLLLTRKVTKW